MQYPTPDMVGFKGQFGAWTDNETSFVDASKPGGVPLEIRTPAVWTGERYYDPAYARHLSRQMLRAKKQPSFKQNEGYFYASVLCHYFAL